MPESSSSESETLVRLKKTSKEVIDYFTTLGTLGLASISKEAEESRVRLRQELIDILEPTDIKVNGDEADGGSVPDLGAEDYEVPTSTLPRNAKLKEADKESVTSVEKKSGSKTSITNSKTDTDGKNRKKSVVRTKSTQAVELPSKDDRKKEGYLTEKKMMRRTAQYWAVLGSGVLYLAKNPSDTQSESKIRLHGVSVSPQKNMREFVLKKVGKNYTFRAESDEDSQAWIDQIQLCITELNHEDGQFSDEEEDYVPPDTASDKISIEPDEVYENEDDESQKVDGVIEDDGDDVYDDIEAPVAAAATLPHEPKRSESSSSAKSNTSSGLGKRTSALFSNVGKSKDGMPAESKLSGYIQKKGTFSWDKKWFVLSEQTLYYSNSESDKKCQGTLSLSEAIIDTKSSVGSDSRPYAVTIKHKGIRDKMQLAWDDSQIYDDWLTGLKSAAGVDQSSEHSTSEKDLKVEEESEVQEEADEPQDDYVNPALSPAAESEPITDEVYDDVVTEPQKFDSKPSNVPQKLPSVKKQIKVGSCKSELKEPERSGYLYRKSTGIIKKWERKWYFVVDKTLYVSTNEEDESCKNLLPLANVKDIAKGAIEKQYPYGIVLQLKPSCGKDFILAAERKEDQMSWVSVFESACDNFNCELSSDEEDGAYLPKPVSEPKVEGLKVDDDGFIMEDIYEDVSQPLEAAQRSPPKEAAKTDVPAPSLPPRNPKLSQPTGPSLPPRNVTSAPAIPTIAEPEPIMDEFYEDMDEVKAQYENARNLVSQAPAEETPATPTKEIAVPKADTEKKSPVLKKKELKKEKESKKEAKKKEKDTKKQKKDKEKSKTLTKPKSKAAELKMEGAVPRSNSFTATSKPEDDGGYVVEDLSPKDEKKFEEPPPIDDDIYEDVVEPPPKPTVTTQPATSVTSPARTAGVMSPPGNVSDLKKSSSPVPEPLRSQSASPGGVKIHTTAIKVSTMAKKMDSAESNTAASSITTSKAKITVTASSSSGGGTFNKPRVKVSEAIYKFQKRDSVSDAVLQRGTLLHKAPGRTRFRKEYCELLGNVMSFYREKGDEKAFATLSLEECELHVVKEQYEGQRYVFSLAAGSAIDWLSAEYQADLKKWLSSLESLVKKYITED